MILDNPGTSPSVIAHAHGFSAVEVAELMPIFLDNLRADFSTADAPALTPPAPQPGETPEEHADRYLRELAQDAGVSERTLTRLFRAATGLTPLKYQQLLRLEQADQLLSQGWTMDSAAQHIGLSDARMLRRLRAAR